MCDVYLKNQWHRSHNVREVDRNLNVSTSLTPFLTTCWVFTLCVVRNRSASFSTGLNNGDLWTHSHCKEGLSETDRRGLIPVMRSDHPKSWHGFVPQDTFGVCQGHPHPPIPPSWVVSTVHHWVTTRPDVPGRKDQKPNHKTWRSSIKYRRIISKGKT